VKCPQCLAHHCFIIIINFVVVRIFQGLRPEAFERVTNTEIKEIIEKCTMPLVQDRFGGHLIFYLLIIKNTSILAEYY